MKRSLSRASKVSTDGQDPLENSTFNIPDAKWEEFLEKEETDLFILGLREEIVQKCIEICFESYLERQSVEFTVFCASVACCKVLNMYYMFRDPGDIDDSIEKESWDPDPEPEPSLIDSWGSFCIQPKDYQTEPQVKAQTQKLSIPPSTAPTLLSEIESCSFMSDFFGWEEEDGFVLPFSRSLTSSSIKSRKKSIFTRTLSSSLETLSLSCLKIFKMGDRAQKRTSNTHFTCDDSLSKNNDDF